MHFWHLWEDNWYWYIMNCLFRFNRSQFFPCWTLHSHLPSILWCDYHCVLTRRDAIRFQRQAICLSTPDTITRCNKINQNSVWAGSRGKCTAPEINFVKNIIKQNVLFYTLHHFKLLKIHTELLKQSLL